ncbi:glucokinase-like ROK family protein [Scopulibacillus darangshiensis]|uniref:Glucokinase-like ROK family protein n=1 Tax=Scopulibacillus darangshiensis TaxID=442528 RepID=A0A4R2NVX9_9BACL|nr:ROK family protein [Scopulibacillus darangshiensis]TCP25575.1 glucokinase-like ROK family protein [Scopulibacillus darangshiensis]
MLIGAVDIGGTAIKYGVVNSEGKIIAHASMPTEAALGGEHVIKRVIACCAEIRASWQLEGIAISSAGQIDNVHGEVVHATDNIPGFTGMAIADMVREATGLPVSVENDVNCTALGEAWMGAASRYDDFLCVTIGTGIGGALFLDGELYTGANFSAGELGHIILYPQGVPCTCGSKGCYEQYASSKALADLAEAAFARPIALPDFFTLVREGDLKAIEVFDHWLDDLTTGMQTLVHIFNPSLIVIGGGISAQGEWLRASIQTRLEEKVMPNHRRSLEVKLAEKANGANLLGAVWHYLKREYHCIMEIDHKTCKKGEKNGRSPT